MAKKPVKTNAMRALEKKKAAYTAHDLQTEATDGMQIAELAGENPDHVFKTLVTVGADKNHYVFMVPVNGHLSLKKAAKAAGVKHVEMIPQKELLPLTGYVHGGCSPLGMKKEFTTFMDQSAENMDHIYFSAGKIGVQIETDPHVLKEILRHFDFADLKEE